MIGARIPSWTAAAVFFSLRTTSPLRERRVPRPWFSPLCYTKSEQPGSAARGSTSFLEGGSNLSTVCNLWFGREPSSLPRWFFGSTQTGRGNGPAAAALHSRLNGLCPSVHPSQRQRCRRRHRRRQRRPRRHGRGAGGGRRWAGGARKILPPPPPRCCMAGGRFRWFPCPQPS